MEWKKHYSRRVKKKKKKKKKNIKTAPPLKNGYFLAFQTIFIVKFNQFAIEWYINKRQTEKQQRWKYYFKKTFWRSAASRGNLARPVKKVFSRIFYRVCFL